MREYIFDKRYAPLCFYKYFHSLWHGFNQVWTYFCNFFLMLPDLNNSNNHLLHRRKVFFWSLRLIIAHRFPIRFIMSEAFPGHASTANPLSLKNMYIFRWRSNGEPLLPGHIQQAPKYHPKKMFWVVLMLKV